MNVLTARTKQKSAKFIADAMCGRLARWLRFLGIDTLYVRNAHPIDVENLARKTGRTIITRRERFLERKGLDTIVLKSELLENQIKELQKQLPLAWTPQSLHRCSLCNEPLKESDKQGIKERVPPYVYDTQERFLECPSCGRVYWQGTHYRRIRAYLETLFSSLLLLVLLLPGCTKKVLYHTSERGVPITRVLIAEEQSQVIFSSPAAINVTSGDKRYRLAAYDTVTITPRSRYHFPLQLSSVGKTPITVNGTAYPGIITIMKETQLLVVNTVDLETYLKGVVPHEIGSHPFSEIEVVKAQAVAARTYAIKHLDLERNPRYDLVATVFDQVYKGMLYRNPVADSAVNATYGKIIIYRGKPIEAKYSSTCGGITSDVRDNWGDEAVPYLRSIPDSPAYAAQPFCSISPLFTWEERHAKPAFYRMLAEKLFGMPGDTLRTDWTITGLRLGRNAKSRRVTLLEIITPSDTFAFKGLDIRKMLKPGDKLLWSNYFTIINTTDSIIINGKGAGHGCGMCQWGAIAMARQGYTFDEIIKHYYRGTHIEKVY